MEKFYLLDEGVGIMPKRNGVKGHHASGGAFLLIIVSPYIRVFLNKIHVHDIDNMASWEEEMQVLESELLPEPGI